MTTIGTPIQRAEDARMLRGDASYVGDLKLPNIAEAAYLVSPMAHARILSVNVEAARRAPGVIDVLTAADVELEPAAARFGDKDGNMRRPFLAIDTVRYVGEPIVAIVGESQSACADAIDLIEVEYEHLDVVMTPQQSQLGETLLFAAAGSNVVMTERGGADGGLPFDDCEVVVEGDFLNQRLAPCPLETRGGLSMWDESGRLHHWSSCQGPHPVRDVLAKLHGLETSQVRVIAPDVGGSFGAKGGPTAEEVLLPILSKRNGRPIRWVPSRSVDMTGLGHGRDQYQHLKIGGDQDGTIKCIEFAMLADAGGYPGMGAMMPGNAGVLIAGPYDVPNVAWSAETVLTNKTPIAAYRGAGRPEAAAAMERGIELFAAAIDMDPLAVRRHNLIDPDQFPYEAATGIVLDSGEYQDSVDRLLASLDYDGLRVEQASRREAGETVQLGIGLAFFTDRTGGRKPSSEYGSVQLMPDGGLQILTGSSSHGQGHHTAWAMIASDRTGVPLDQIVVLDGDTDVVPRGGHTAGSRSAQFAGSAVAVSSEALVDEARVRAAEMLEANIQDVVLDVDRAQFHVAGAPGARSVGWADVAAHDEAEPLQCEADYLAEGGSYPFGAYAAVVSVDTETGDVVLDRMVTVDDAGVVINPLIAFGQVHGGLGQGIAQALYEEVVYDDIGNPLSGNFLDYLIPSAAEMPSFECSLLETASQNNLLGAKGIAESGCLGAPPAVQNAVIDALAHLGIKHIDMPLSPQRVWSAIKSA